MVPVEMARLLSIFTDSTRLSAPKSASSMAKARPAAPPSRNSAAAPARARRGRLEPRPDFTLGRLAIPLDGGPMLERAREVVEQHEDEETADQDETDALVGEGEPLGGRAAPHGLDGREEHVSAV